MRGVILYPSGWLYNAGLVGLLRILRKRGLEPEELIREGGVYLEPSFLDPEAFSLAYFQTALYFTVPKGLRREGGKKTSQDQEKFSEIKQQLLEAKTISEFKTLLREKAGDTNCNYILGISQRLYFNLGPFNPVTRNRIESFQTRFLIPAKERLENRETISSTLTCCFCGGFPIPINEVKKGLENLKKGHSIDTVFTEGYFAPLALSPSTQFNFFYWEVPDLFLCEICRLILLCSFAGFQRKPPQLQTMEPTEFIFVNFPDFRDTWENNEYLWRAWQDRKMAYGTLYEEVLTRKLEREYLKRKARWTLENILFVEFSAPRRPQIPKYKYFHITKDVAKLLIFEQEKKFLKYLWGQITFGQGSNSRQVDLRTEVIKRLLEGDDLMELAYKAGEALLNKERGFTISLSIQAIAILDTLRRCFRLELEGGDKMVKKTYGILWQLRRLAEDAFQEMDEERRKNRAYRLLELVRLERKEDFYHEVVRIYMSQEKLLPRALLSLLDERDEIGFRPKAYAWLSGFLSGLEQDARPSQIQEQEEETEQTG